MFFLNSSGANKINMKIVKKTVSIILCTILIICTFSGCSSSNKKINFLYPFSADVNSYDPQIAGTPDEYLIIENTFEGLVRVTSDGEVRPGVAESWDISSDGLTYTFKLKKGVKWNIDTELKTDGSRKEDSRLEYMGYDFNPDITANDFVFALKRAVKAETKAPLFSTISGIKNAAAINSGKKSVNSLGVKALDDYTLQITLSAKDPSFMKTLSTAIAMPCNEKFFNATKGRYGLTTEYTLFNGQFYVSQILDTSYLLKQNKQYTGPYPTVANELTLKIINEEDELNEKTDTVSRLESGYYDAAFIKGTETERLKKAQGITYYPYNDTTWAFLLNTKHPALKSKTIREALCTGFTRLTDTQKDYLKNASNLIPSSCTIGANNANKAIGKTTVNQDIPKSKELWKSGLKFIELKKFELTVITCDSMQNYVKQLLQGIQSGIESLSTDDNGEEIGLTVKVEVMSEADLKKAIAKKEYDIAFCPFKAKNISALNYLQQIIQSNPTSIETGSIEKALSRAERSNDLKTISQNIKKAEKEMIESYSICPMIFETSYYAAAQGVKDIQFHIGSGRVSFVYATRED